MKKMGLSLLGLITLSISLSAAAYPVGEVTCLENNGCLTRGWTVRDYRSGHVGYIDCVDQDCAVHGWTESYTSTNRDFEVTCEPEGCFNRGWMTYDRYTHQAVSQTQCMMGHARTPDCMSGGWAARDFYGGQLLTYCVNYDCAHEGWFVYLPNGGYQRAYCKVQGDCFAQGWTVDQR